MGQDVSRVKPAKKNRLHFINALLNDIEALEYMVGHDMFEKDIQRVGAEQEICIINDEWGPQPINIELLSELNNPSFTTELAKYNIEINLDPYELKAGCFKKMEKQLLTKFKMAQKAAEKLNSKLILAGILPTITRKYIHPNYLTPLQRYRHLSKQLRDMRGGKFDLYLKGVDELHIRHDSIMFEAANTSFQTHLQIAPADFISSYNWALAISAPVLAASSNSPLLFGKELWSEIRIALFQQSIDTRHSIDEVREQHPRVTFGQDWIYNSIAEMYQEDISRFEVIITDTIEENSMELLKQGKIPKLKALRLHNSTVYRWNRLCYGITDEKPHMRIECRYVPAGPGIQDEIANMAFWTGLMMALPENAKKIWEHFDFKDVKSNFFKAARSGVESVLVWMDKELSVKKLIEQELLPLAFAGLKKCGMTDEEIYIYLGTIERRMLTHTGSQWQVKNYRKLKKEMHDSDAVAALTSHIYAQQQKNIPICEWKNIDVKKAAKHIIKNMVKVKQLMSIDVLTVFPEDPVALVEKIMQWHDIDHIVVENKKGKLTGIITSGHIKEVHEKQEDISAVSAKDIMRKDILTIDPDDEISHALDIMRNNWISSLPVVHNNQLMGIITKNDMLRWISLQG